MLLRRSSIDGPLTSSPGGVRLAIRLTPRSRADCIEGIVGAADGRTALKVSLTAPPAEGRANAALIELLAKEWGVPKRYVVIVGGLKSRDKIVRIAGNPDALLKRLGPLFAGPGARVTAGRRVP